MKIPDLPGVYKWTNKINGKVYIGKAVNLRLRKNGHTSLKKETGAFANAKRKYGIENFKFSIIEIFPNRTSFIEDYIVERETFWIGFYDATNKSKGYNICPIGTNSSGAPMLPHVREAIRKANTGRKASDETRRKMSESSTRDKLSEKARWEMGSSLRGKKVPPEVIEKRRKARIGIPSKKLYKKVNQIDPKTGEVIKTWDAIKLAAEGLGDLSLRRRISEAVNGKRAELVLGFKWSFADIKV